MRTGTGVTRNATDIPANSPSSRRCMESIAGNRLTDASVLGMAGTISFSTNLNLRLWKKINSFVDDVDEQYHVANNMAAAARDTAEKNAIDAYMHQLEKYKLSVESILNI